jgi:hypothetical protein
MRHFNHEFQWFLTELSVLGVAMKEGKAAYEYISADRISSKHEHKHIIVRTYLPGNTLPVSTTDRA